MALKMLKKTEIIRLKQVDHVRSEKKILETIHHPFIVELQGTFQTESHVFMLLDYACGGELFSLLRREGRFANDVGLFFATEIVLAFQYLHSKDIAYRDLKPENLLVDKDGHVRITDFGFAKIVKDKTMTLCGTPEYLAPEMVKQEGHDKGVDWWSLGVLIYEMTIGVTPFFSKSRLTLINNIKKEEVIFPDKKKYKIDYSDDFVDIVLKLLSKDKKERLGSKGDIEEILEHPYFASLDLDALVKKEIKPPYLPEFTDKDDLGSYFKLKTGKKDVADTMIPSNKLKKIKKTDFSNF